MWLFVRCQQDENLSPFTLPNRQREAATRNSRNEILRLQSTYGAPSQISSEDEASTISQSSGTVPLHEVDDSATSSNLSSRPNRSTSQPSSSKPTLTRTTSGGGRKRTSFVAGGARAKTRPQLGRKRSSQAGATAVQPTIAEAPRSPKSVLKSPRSSIGEEESATVKAATSRLSQQLDRRAIIPRECFSPSSVFCLVFQKANHT